jgi:hypothetical protein
VIRATGRVGWPTAHQLGVWASTPVRTHDPLESRLLGRSVDGRRIVAHRYGEAGGKVVVAVGQIHGNEPGGPMISAYLRVRGAPDGIVMWVIDSVNPDGWVVRTRRNSCGVDLNRNFDSGTWAPSTPGIPTYGGPRPASEPETRALQRFLAAVRPRLMIVWHQAGRHVDDNRTVADYSLNRSPSTSQRRSPPSSIANTIARSRPRRSAPSKASTSPGGRTSATCAAPAPTASFVPAHPPDGSAGHAAPGSPSPACHRGRGDRRTARLRRQAASDRPCQQTDSRSDKRTTVRPPR